MTGLYTTGPRIDDTRVHAFVEAALGPYRLVRERSWAHGESRVWEVLAGPATFYVKRHARQHKFEQEWRAYRDWVPVLEAAAPRLIAVSGTESGVMILSALPGEVASTLSLGAAQEAAVFQAAGQHLRRFHDLPHQDPDPASVYLNLHRKLDKWTALATGLVDARAINWVAAEVGTLLAVPGLLQVPCHGDFTPRNWLVNCSGTERAGPKLDVGIIDFEHAEPGLWLQDLSRLWSQVWPGRPELEAAFFSGYGRPLSAPDLRLLTSLCALDALATVVWARQHGDAAFEAQGHRVLKRLC